jgi:hypothetical protein
MSDYSIDLSSKDKWVKCLNRFENLDFHFYPDYHDLYNSRYKNSDSFLWVYENKEKIFLYPFHKTKINLDFLKNEIFYDISSTYGFVGPVSNTMDESFISDAWQKFDGWALKQNIISEFIRFNPLKRNHNLSHKNTIVEFNRQVGVSDFTKGELYFKNKIPSKTKNMINKALKNGFKTSRLNFSDYKNQFIKIYLETMERNNATDFFNYDEEYFNKLENLKETEFYGITQNNILVAGGIFFVSNSIASYHLGVCLSNYLKFGLSNLYLFDASIELIKKKVLFMNLGGGRSTAVNDGLLKFKRDNSTDLKEFFIGKRVLNKRIYEIISEEFKIDKKQNNKLIFYR